MSCSGVMLTFKIRRKKLHCIASLSMDLLSLLFVFQLFSVGNCQLLTQRSVQCLSDEMRVALEFSQPFSGVVYAQNFYTTEQCRWNGNGLRQLGIPIPLSTQPTSTPYCGVAIKDQTGEFSVTLIISPIRGLLVDGMEALTVRCLYNIDDVTLTLPAGGNGAGIFVSPQSQAGVVTGSGGSPFLQMRVLDSHGINGDPIQSAQVGQRITLDVSMQETTIYDFWVHDCYAHDGTNTPEASIAIIDSNGCAVRLARAIDPPVFSPATNPGGTKNVYVHMYGFQFTTSQLVYFECQVKPCLQTCSRPQCVQNANAAQRKRRQVGDENEPNSVLSPETVANRNYSLTTVLRIEPQQLANIIPAANEQRSPVVKTAGTGSLGKSEICINTSVAIIILIIFIVVCVVSLFVSIYMCYRARGDKEGNRLSTQEHSISYYSQSPINATTQCNPCTSRPFPESPSPEPAYTPPYVSTIRTVSAPTASGGLTRSGKIGL